MYIQILIHLFNVHLFQILLHPDQYDIVFKTWCTWYESIACLYLFDKFINYYAYVFIVLFVDVVQCW